MTFALENKLLTAYQAFSPRAAAELWELQGWIQPRGKSKHHTFPRNDKKNKIHPLSNTRSRFNWRLQLRLFLRLPNKTGSKIVKNVKLNTPGQAQNTLQYDITVKLLLLTGSPSSPIPGNPGSPLGPGFPWRDTALPRSAGSTGHTSHGSPWKVNASQTKSYVDEGADQEIIDYVGTFSPLDPPGPLGPYENSRIPVKHWSDQLTVCTVESHAYITECKSIL